MSQVFKAFVAGEWVEKCSTGETFQDISPADTTDIVGVFPVAGKEEVDAAHAAAREAYKKWRSVPAPKRGEIIKHASDLCVKHKEDLAKTETREMGKILAETRGDVQEAIDTGYYMAGEGRRLFGHTVPCELPNKRGFSLRMPVGVCAMISPWNFPIAIPSWKIFPALIAGNACILKPATDTPASAAKFVQILHEAGVPQNCVQILYGHKAGPLMVEHEGNQLISFTGSTSIGSKINSIAGKMLKKVSLELGGKNAQIVMDDANIDLAMEGALWGAFGTSGQRCTATSRLILHKKIADEFVSKLADRAKKIKVGNGLDESVQMGPVVSEGQMKSVLEYIEIGKNEDKAELVCGGKRLTGGAFDKGWFIEPTIFSGVTRQMRLFKEEIFGPVLSVITVGSFEEAIETHNDCAYGLSSSIYTNNVNLAFQAIERMEAGITYVNGPTIGAEIQLPFGGVKGTGNGHRESSEVVFDMYTDWKSVYVDYSGRLQRAQIDTDTLTQ